MKEICLLAKRKCLRIRVGGRGFICVEMQIKKKRSVSACDEQGFGTN